ncbi:MAG: hypothetical protein V7632_1629, partial [Bradyrhizobium sp.]
REGAICQEEQGAKEIREESGQDNDCAEGRKKSRQEDNDEEVEEDNHSALITLMHA